MDIVGFDTSTINNLLDDPERDRLIAAMGGRYVVYASALNILEIAKTKSAERREMLRALTKQVAGEFEPLDLPNHLVRQTCRLFAAGEHDWYWSVRGDREVFWIAMSSPNSLGEEERQEAIKWAEDIESGIADSNAGLRQKLDAEVFVPNPGSRPKTPPQLLRMYVAGKWPLRYDLVSQIYKRETGKVLPLSRLDTLLHAEPSIWPLYLMAYAFSAYYGAVWTNESGPRNRVGVIDLLYSVYLPVYDVFVTHDIRHGGQYDALRVLNAFNSRRPRTKVLNWQQFRGKVLQTG